VVEEREKGSTVSLPVSAWEWMAFDEDEALIDADIR
jgi:hypothetical protein